MESFQFKSVESFIAFKHKSVDNNKIGDKIGLGPFVVTNFVHGRILGIQDQEELEEEFFPIFDEDEVRMYLTKLSENKQSNLEDYKVNALKNELLVIKANLTKEIHRIDTLLDNM
ncbi:hypothetical protein ZPAH1_orf00295 [Aeromonas phage ZPAH1]|nr:hypothetical protein ZPAH1_orf00295 [Aeromonas phage ZPAH1]